ncbi:MAG: hypothetical protein HLX51_01340 [Micrococcaceae bacterium]|nr:hypothetical protein [Micrococcaceae bacterium]
MTKTILLDGNIAGDILLFNEDLIEDEIDKVRGVGTIIENVYNPDTQKFDKPVPYPFTVFGRMAVNMADTVSNVKDETGKYPPLLVGCKLNSFSKDGENEKGEIVEKTHLGLNVVSFGPSLRWHTAMIEEDEHADAGRSSRSSRGRSGRNSSGRRRGRDEEPEDVDEEIDDQVEDEENDAQDEEEKPRRSSRSSRSSGSRSSGSRTSRSSGSRTSRSGSSRSSSSRSGGSRSSRSSGASRRSRSNYDD